jgi:endo-alpha-1,4-polygalactosaminidase (GH114 family)
MKKVIFTLLIGILMAACQKDGSRNSDVAEVSNEPNVDALPSNKSTWWKPKAGVSFDWDLDDLEAGDNFTADVVDVDAFTTTAAQVAKLHSQGKKVIAYISVCTIEDDRPDISLLPKEVIGKVYPEWPKERWLDIRQFEKLRPWLNSRFNMIISKGFDAIEPDNIDIYTNKPGFNITVNDSKKYCDSLIAIAHKNGLGIGQKNVPELTVDYSSKFDWALTEDAFNQKWQDKLKPYIVLDKPVFAVEYTDLTSQSTFTSRVCPESKKLGYFAILKRRDLDKWAFNCK